MRVAVVGHVEWVRFVSVPRLPVTGEIRRLVGASTDEIFAAAVAEGMTTLRQDGLRLCLEGVSSLDEIRRVTGDRLG